MCITFFSYVNLKNIQIYYIDPVWTVWEAALCTAEQTANHLNYPANEVITNSGRHRFLSYLPFNYVDALNGNRDT